MDIIAVILMNMLSQELNTRDKLAISKGLTAICRCSKIDEILERIKSIPTTVIAQELEDVPATIFADEEMINHQKVLIILNPYKDNNFIKQMPGFIMRGHMSKTAAYNRLVHIKKNYTDKINEKNVQQYIISLNEAMKALNKSYYFSFLLKEIETMPKVVYKSEVLVSRDEIIYFFDRLQRESLR